MNRFSQCCPSAKLTFGVAVNRMSWTFWRVGIYLSLNSVAHFAVGSYTKYLTTNSVLAFCHPEVFVFFLMFARSREAKVSHLPLPLNRQQLGVLVQQQQCSISFFSLVWKTGRWNSAATFKWCTHSRIASSLYAVRPRSHTTQGFFIPRNKTQTRAESNH